MEAGEQLIFVLRPTMVFVIVRYLLAVAVTAAAVTLYFYLDTLYPQQIPWWTVLIVTAIAFVFPFYHHILRQREIYTLTSRRIEFTYGILAKIRRNIPLSKVQDVTVTRSLLERLLGIGDIVIDSAAESGKIPLRNVRDPEKHADLILRQIERR